MAENCTGCVCKACKNSEYVGAVYRCPYSSCRKCQEGDINVVRTVCDKCLPIEPKDTSLRL